MEGLGRAFNIVPTADAVEVSMRQCSAITFVGVGTDTYNVEACTDAAGAGAVNLNAINNYYRSTSAAGAAAWTLVTQAVGNAFAATGGGIACVTIDAASLPDGYDYVRCSSVGAGLVIALQHDLLVMRFAPNLVAPAV